MDVVLYFLLRHKETGEPWASLTQMTPRFGVHQRGFVCLVAVCSFGQRPGMPTVKKDEVATHDEVKAPSENDET